MLKNENIRYIVNKHQDAQGDNTKLCFYFWKEVCKTRGIMFDDRLLDVMLDYKPEALTRKRRELYPPTDKQLKQEQIYHNTYA